MELLLGIDIGTTNCRAILFDRSGRLVAGESVPTPTYHPRPELTEHDPDELWAAVAGAIRRALERAGGRRVAGVAVTSVGEAGTLVDSRGRALTPMVAWHDARTAPELRRWRERVDQRFVDGITEMPAKPIFTLFKLQRLRDSMPDAYGSAVRWLHEADFVAYRLCGEMATDYSVASRTLLFDLRARAWSRDLIELAGLRADLLPELRQAGEPLGHVTAAAAAETGLAAGTPVAVGGHDHIVGALAAGVVRAGQCLDSLGTAEAVFLPLDGQPPPEAAHRTGCTFGAHVARGRTFLLDGLLSGGASVGWARGLLTPGAEGFEQLERLAASAPPGSRGALFLPRLAAGERGAFAGLTLASGPAELARAVYEGLAFGWRQLLERAEASLGLRASSIKVIGGGARSAFWLQAKADALGRPLELLEIEESVALGAAMLGGIGSGVYRDEEEALATVRLAGRMVLPDQERAELYDRIYKEQFLHLAPALFEIHGAAAERSEGQAEHGGRPR